MATIYFHTFAVQDAFYKNIRTTLGNAFRFRGHQVVYYHTWQDSEASNPPLSKADIFISLVFNVNSDVWLEKFYDDLYRIKSYAETVNKLFFILYVGVGNDEIRLSSLNARVLAIPEFSEEVIDAAASTVYQAMSQHQGASLGESEIVQKEKEEIDNSAAIFVNEANNGLQIRENKLRAFSNLCLGIGFGTIALAIILVFIFSSAGIEVLSDKRLLLEKLKTSVGVSQSDSLKRKDLEFAAKIMLNPKFDRINWGAVVYLGIKSILIISLLLAASKYAFSLAKSYMIESLKIADRIHAIRFGQFYLRVYGGKIEPAELKEAFRDWNISTSNSAFSTQKSDELDLKYVDKLFDIFSKFANATEKK